MITGDYTGIDPNSGFRQSRFSFTGGTAEFVGSTLSGLLADNLAVDLSPFPSDPNATSGDVNLSTLTVRDNQNPAHTAMFDLTHAMLMITGDTTGMITADATLRSEDFGDLADLSLFRLGGTGLFVATYEGIGINEPPIPGGITTLTDPDGNASWPRGPVPVSGHFVITPGATAIPEPGSLALWGLVSLGGIAWLVRRYR
jgi:hypothetical protein